VLKETNNKYHIYTEELKLDTSLPRSSQAANLAQQFATRLEQMALAHPYEWFNFFDFWNDPDA
jgi:predicted LPLAT superfamily acyltransferase